MTDPRDAFELVDTVLDTKYRVDRVVAEGGFGIVYAGHHLRLDIALAIKVLKPNRSLSAELRAEVVSRFVSEARTTARLSHPNIARALDTGILHTEPFPEGLPWIALEWLEGRTLEEELSRTRGQGGRSPREALRLLGPALDAMAYAHRLGVAHRDLKPNNVMLVPERDGMVPKILDFGIAKVVEEPVSPVSGQTTTQSALIAFSPGYAAPEQISRARTGPWTDVHALALMLTEVLSDEPAYAQADGGGILVAILSPDRPTPARRGLDVGPWEAVLVRATSLNPLERQADAGALLAELTASLDSAEAHWRGRRPSEVPSATVRVSDLPAFESEPPPVAPVPASTTAPASSVLASLPPATGRVISRRFAALSVALALAVVAGASVWLGQSAEPPVVGVAGALPAGTPTTPPKSTPAVSPAAPPEAPAPPSFVAAAPDAGVPVARKASSAERGKTPRSAPSSSRQADSKRSSRNA